MEYVTGGTLHEKLDRRLSLTEVLDLVRPLAAALDYAHRQDVIHRDIKPSNVLLDDDGNPKLSDFGLARLMQGGEGLTRGPSVLGTPEYMAPEQALGRPADERSDLYALGVIVYQMLLGRIPFKADTPVGMLMAHIHEDVPPPSSIDPSLDPRLERVLIKALSKAPEKRHRKATEMVEELASPLAAPEPDVDAESAPTLETPPPAAVPDPAAAVDADQVVSKPKLEEDRISLDQARVLAIRHSRENTDFYGPRWARKELVWEVIDSEAGDDYFQVRLSYRPARRFWGQSGVELFTIDKTGSVELRQVLDEPTEGLRQLVNEPVQVMGLRFPLIGLALLIVVAIGAAVLLTSGEKGEEGASTAAGAVSLRLTPGEPGQLVSADGDVTVDVVVGSVDRAARLWLQPMKPEQFPAALPAGFAPSQKVFDLSVASDQITTGSFSFSKSITISVRLSAQGRLGRRRRGIQRGYSPL